MKIENSFTKLVGIEHPIICGAMYPCSNPELVAAVSQAGGIGIIQPLSLIFVHKYDLREGIQYIKKLTKKPIGMNIITEKSSKIYEDRMKKWLEIALSEGVRFFVTSLGNPKWVVDRVASLGGVVFHDVTDKKWAEKAMQAGVHGLICVNNNAGGHAGTQNSDFLFQELKNFNVPIICAGGISDKKSFEEAMQIGYMGVQMGTRFIATYECNAHDDYKKAIIKATANDIVLTEKISGVPVSIIKTDYITKIGIKASPVAKFMLKHSKLKHWIRAYYTFQAVWKLKRASLEGASYKDYWQAGKSVDGCHEVLSVSDVIKNLVS